MVVGDDGSSMIEVLGITIVGERRKGERERERVGGGNDMWGISILPLLCLCAGAQ